MAFSRIVCLLGTGLVLDPRLVSPCRLLEAATGGFVSPRAIAAASSNPLVTENTKTGTTSWKLANPARPTARSKAMLRSPASRAADRSASLSTTNEANYTIEIFRMGWYSGAGSRQVMGAVQRAGVKQPMPTPDPAMGLIECNWTNPYTLTIPNNTSDPTDWMSGVYLAKLTAGASGKQSYIIFVVRDDARACDLLFQSSVTTYQAYNYWGGRSLYNSDNGVRPYKVSFNRPYAVGSQPTSVAGVGAGEFLTNLQPDSETEAGGWEYNMVRFLEREGYDVSYGTDLDTHENGNLLLAHKGYLSVGHDEYWSWEMRQNVEAARDHARQSRLLHCQRLFLANSL